MNSLRESAVTGVKWTAISATFATVTALLFQLIKARYLTPEDFAYLSILMIIIGLSRNLEVAGFNQGIIQRDVITTEEASSLLVFNLFFSLFASAVIYFISAPVAGFFELYRLDHYLKIISLAVFFQGLSHLFIAFLEKHFYFRFISMVQIMRQFFFVSLATALIVLGWGVMGFVLGHTAATILSASLFVIGGLKNRVTPLKLYFRIDDLRPFIKFGIFVTGRQTMNIITKQIDELIILHFLGPEIMGVYFFGKNMLERLRQLLNMSYLRLVFPLLSKLKHDQARLSEVYYKMSRYLFLIAFPLFIGVSLTAHLFVPLIFGEQWNDSIIIFQVFSITTMLKMFAGILAGNLLYSVNRPGTVLWIDMATDLIYIAALMAFAPWGIEMVIFLYVIYQTIKFFAMQIAAHRHLSFNLFDYFSNFKQPAGLTLVMGGVVGGLLYAAGPWLDPVFLLAACIGAGAISYLGLTWLFDQKSIKEIKKMAFKPGQE